MSTTYDNGGPAFPVPSVSWQQDGQTCTAFGTEGMTLRDYFAAAAIAATNPKRTPMGRAVEAYEIADRMLDHRNDSFDEADEMREHFDLDDEENKS
jgi:hypothetical protein